MPWRHIINLRHLIAHHYHRVDMDQLWTIATVNIPEVLKELVPKWFRRCRREPTQNDRSEEPSTPPKAEPADAPAPVVDEPFEPPISDLPSIVEIVDISYMCGPNDCLWAEVVVVASETVLVSAEFAFEGTAYGRSEVVALEAGEQEPIGFYPERPDEAYEKTGTVDILEVGATTPSATSDAVPELPDGAACG